MISVLIATRDRAELLSTTLASLAMQDWPGEPYEILVADNGSIDSTPEKVEAAARRSAAPIIYLREPRQGKSHALNTAVSGARGDLLVLTDDDVLPSRAWLATYARVFRQSEADFVVGRILPLWEAPPPLWLSPALHGVLAVPDGGDQRLRLARGEHEEIMPLGVNMAIRRQVLDRVGGWNPDFGKLQGSLRTGEDHEFALKMLAAGFVGLYDPEAVVRHRVSADRLKLSYFARWFYENGVVEARLERSFPSSSHYVGNVPRHLWRQFASDLLLATGAMLACSPASATAATMRILWFAGYTRARWSSLDDRVPRPQDEPAVMPRS